MRNAKLAKKKNLVPVTRTAATADLAYLAVALEYAEYNVLKVQSLHVRLQAVLARILVLAMLQPASGRIVGKCSAAMSAMRA